MLFFVNDYCEGAHPAILQKLLETNMEKLSGYGTDKYCDSAKEKIRKACGCPDADVFFLVGGTQTNATIIGSVLNRYEGVLAAQTGHVSCHEAGGIEYTGHKVLTLPAENGKIKAVCRRCWSEPPAPDSGPSGTAWSWPELPPYPGPRCGRPGWQ